MSASTATLTLVPSGTLVKGQVFTASLAITNNDTGAVQIMTVQPYAYDTSVGLASAPNTPIDFGDVNIGPGVNLTVPNGAGGLTIGIPVFSTAGSTQPAFSMGGGIYAKGTGTPLTVTTYKIGANVMLSNGEYIAPTEVAVTIKEPGSFNGRS